MTLSEAVFKLKAGEAELRRLGVTKLFVFGSTVRGDARPDSDVDLFIEDDGTIGLFDVMDIGDAASAMLERTADVRTRVASAGLYARMPRPRPCRFSDA